MNNTGNNLRGARTRLALVFLLSLLIVQACKKNDAPAPPTPPGKFYVTDVVGFETELGLLINDPIDQVQYAAFGHKDTTGMLDSIRIIIVKEPGTDEWLAHEMSSDYTPTRTTTSTGQTVEYHDLDPVKQTGTVVIKDTKSGGEIYRGSDLDFPKSFFDAIKEAKRLGKDRDKGFGPNWKAEMAYVATAAFGCAMGIGAIGSSGGIAALWSIYNTYQNCKSTLEAVNNLMNGEPAFGCIGVMDNYNSISGFAETIINSADMEGFALGLMPAAIGYGAQQSAAGQCRVPWPGKEGGGHGDPHLYTPDGFHYDFQGYGEFIAVKSTADSFEVQVRQEAVVSSLQATFNTGIAVNTGADIVSVSAGPQNIYINKQLRAPDFQTLPLKQGAILTLATEKGFPVLTIRTAKNDRIRVRLTAGFKGTHLDYTVQLSSAREGKVYGLLGNYDGNPANDLVLPGGQPVPLTFNSLYPTFADSWRVEQAKSLFYYPSGKSTNSYTKKDFPKTAIDITPEKRAWAKSVCVAAGVKGEPALSGCIFDVAATGDAALAEAAAWSLKNWEEGKAPLGMTHIELQGDATLVDNYIRLTRLKPYISGQAFWTKPLTAGFEAAFTFLVPPVGNGGADGIALLIAKDVPVHKLNVYPGSAGQLGYQGVPNSLAIEFDTNTDGGENSNHLAIHTKGTEPNSTHYTARVANNDNLPEFQDGLPHQVKITYQTGKITVYFDGAKALEYAVDLSAKLGLGGQYYVGLTSSTASSYAQHEIHAFTVKPL